MVRSSSVEEVRNEYVSEKKREDFIKCTKGLLPNEDIRFGFEGLRGFWIFTDRRVARVLEPDVVRPAIPLDCIHSIEQRKGNVCKLAIIKTDNHGHYKSKKKGQAILYETKELEVLLPKQKEENHAILQNIRAGIENVNSNLEEMKSALHDVNHHASRDVSYAEGKIGERYYNAPRGWFEIHREIVKHPKIFRKVIGLVDEKKWKEGVATSLVRAFVYNDPQAWVIYQEYDNKTGTEKRDKEGRLKLSDLELSPSTQTKTSLTYHTQTSLGNLPWMWADIFHFLLGVPLPAWVPGSEGENFVPRYL
ncbi:MAG: hypothetical protein ACFFEF_16490 [Candidatus Thorarchaeota archaeon]